MRLIALSGPQAGREVRVIAELTVGRSPDCDLTLTDPKVSRRHAAVVNVAGGLLLRDCSSLNGTWLNDERIDGERRLAPGDRVRIGGSEFIVEAADDGAARGDGAERRGEEPQPGADPQVTVADSSVMVGAGP
jgi:pSer/pThr/pTyr-binding forkhead associated (FHA) protein